MARPLPSPPQPPFPEKLPMDDPLLAAQNPSIVLEWLAGPKFITTTPHEVYGPAETPIRFSVGNGGAGYTGILRALAEKYLGLQGNDFRIGWVTNHSRNSQAALLGNVVQIALPYEPKIEDITIAEGWATRVCRAFNDHFIIVGPVHNPAGISESDSPKDAFLKIAEKSKDPEAGILFETRGDGSATFAKESVIWALARTTPGAWYRVNQAVPFEALKSASTIGAYLLSDRSTYLTARHKGAIPNLRVFVEGGDLLLNPCSAMIRNDLDGCNPQAAHFAAWLGSPEAQELVKSYGRDWEGVNLPLFSVAAKDEVDDQDRLPGKQ